MSIHKSYKFEHEGWGSLELDISKSTRNFFQPPILEEIPFHLKGFGRTSLDSDPFYFFEWQKIQYSYLIEDSTTFTPPFKLIINNRTINESKVRGNNHLLAGQFSYDDEVGETKIEIIDTRNRLIFELYTEVFPQKMDYKSDYKAMMADVSQIIQNLAYDSLKQTFKRSRARISGQSTQNEWWNILDALFEELLINLEVIRRQPKHEIRNREKVLPIEKIKSASKKNIEWLLKNTKYSNESNKGIKVTSSKFYTHALSSKKYITYDTYENRFIAWAVIDIIEKLRQYKRHIDAASNANDYSVLIDRIKMYQSRLQGLLHDSPFNEVGKFEKISYFSTSLTRGAGYRDFLHIYLLLTRGLEITANEIFKIEQKNISTLYEYWCFLKLVQILKEQNDSEIDFQDLIKISANKFYVRLKKGTPSRVKLEKKDTKETTTIYYNREFNRDGKKVFTYNQIPDYSIEFQRAGFKKPFWYLFDAKYRFDEYDTNDNNSYNVPQDAIGQLHRYRDAILHTEPTNTTYRGAIKNLGGIILYPYPLSENEFEKNVFYKSIEHVNIGALPFLPSKSKLVGDLLNELINKRLPEEHFEKFIEMDKTEYNEKRNVWNEWLTIGVIPFNNQNERVNFLENEMLFHIPYVKNTHSKLYLTKKILICKARSTLAFLFDIDNWEILTDKDLQSRGTTWLHNKEKYVVFHISNKTSVNVPFKRSPINFRYTTLKGLDNYLSTGDTNYFYLSTADSARLYEELKKDKSKKIVINWKDNPRDPSLIEFSYGDSKIFSSDLYKELHYAYNGELLSLFKLLTFIRN